MNAVLRDPVVRCQPQKPRGHTRCQPRNDSGCALAGIGDCGAILYHPDGEWRNHKGHAASGRLTAGTLL